jgi:hypothetical protein
VGIFFLSRDLRSLTLWEREESLQDLWEHTTATGGSAQVIRDYRECCKESGPTYRRHQD